jgi:hypothetical protein
MLAGCAGNTLRPGDAPKAAPLPAGMDRDELLSTIAACHLRRVAQNEDRGATDAVVITAVEAYGFSVRRWWSAPTAHRRRHQPGESGKACGDSPGTPASCSPS